MRAFSLCLNRRIQCGNGTRLRKETAPCRWYGLFALHSQIMILVRPLLALLLISAASAAEPFRPNLGPDLTAITVQSGDLTLLLRQASQWTPGRIDFRGKPMTTERSAYGTVFNFTGTGFIGTGHLENEPEPLQSLAFVIDGQEIQSPSEKLSGDHFQLKRVSNIRGCQLTCLVELKNNHLIETSTIQTTNAVPLHLVYHFMHAWRPTVSSFLAGLDAETEPEPEPTHGGDLNDDSATARQFVIKERVDWVAVYEPESGQYAVSRLLAAPKEGGHISMIWNVPGSYRKYYLKCFDKDTVPANFEGTWRMVTAFGIASPEQWQIKARELAAALR
jgi:hypothetical protein